VRALPAALGRLALALGLMAALRAVAPSVLLAPWFGPALGFALLLLAARQAGAALEALGLPRITGYLLCGLLAGPEVLGLVPAQTLRALRVVSGVAIGLIALSAGAELDLRALRPRLGAVLRVSLAAVPLAALATGALAVALGPRLPFIAALPPDRQWYAALTLGVVLASLSPAVTIALIAETRARGPLSETALGVVVIADMLIIVAFSLAHALDGGGGASPVSRLALELGGSALAGTAVALAIAAFGRLAPRRLGPSAVLATLLVAELGGRAHLDPLLVCLCAGLLLSNALGLSGARLAQALAPATAPIYAVFFALAGAGMRLGALATLGPLALLFALTRAGALTLGARAGIALGEAPAAVRGGIALALVSQAGVSVGLAEMLARHFPRWGVDARVLVLAVVVLNELAGPVLFGLALRRAGEVGEREIIRPDERIHQTR